MRAAKPMRVVYDVGMFGVAEVYPSARAGIYRVVEQVARGLVESGECDVSFSVLESARLLLHARDHLRCLPGLTEVPLVTPLRSAGFVRAIDRRLHRLESASRHSYLDRARRPLFARMLRLYERLVYRPATYAAQEADIFHSPQGALPPPAPGRTSACRFLTIHDLIPRRFPHWFQPHVLELMESVYRSLTPDDWVLAISESTRRDLCELCGVDPGRVFVTPLAADPALFHRCDDAERQAEVRRRYGIPDEPYFMSLNTLEPRKNMDHAVRSFARLVQQERVGDLNFVLVGSWGWKHESIRDAIAAAGPVRDRIITTGYVADEDLSALYSGACGFVYPSRYEGFGLPPLEAMHCGVPVVTSNVSSLPEVVGDAGILLDPDDGDGLCHALFELHTNAALRAQMRKRSLERARQFSWDRCVLQTLDAYRTALSS